MFDFSSLFSNPWATAGLGALGGYFLGDKDPKSAIMGGIFGYNAPGMLDKVSGFLGGRSILGTQAFDPARPMDDFDLPVSTAMGSQGFLDGFTGKDALDAVGGLLGYLDQRRKNQMLEDLYRGSNPFMAQATQHATGSTATRLEDVPGGQASLDYYTRALQRKLAATGHRNAGKNVVDTSELRGLLENKLVMNNMDVRSTAAQRLYDPRTSFYAASKLADAPSPFDPLMGALGTMYTRYQKRQPG